MRWAALWLAMDLRGAVRGQSLVAAVAVACLAFTSASASVLHAAVAALSHALRHDLDTDRGPVITVEPAVSTGTCPLTAVACGAPGARADATLAALGRDLGAARQRGRVARVGRTLLRLRSRSGLRPVSVIGADVALFGLQAFTVPHGRLWTPGDERAGRPVAVLGRALFDSLAQRGDLGRVWPVPSGGRRLRLLGRRAMELEVVGVIEASAVTSLPVDDAIVVPYDRLPRLAGAWAIAGSLVAPLESEGSAASLLERLRRLERRVPRWTGALAVSSTREQLGEVAQVETALRRGVGALSLILVLAEVAAVTALMVTIARAHARAIGIARALGAPRVVVVAQGGVVGGALGVVGVACGTLVALALVAVLPAVLDVPPLDVTSAVVSCLRGAAPSLVMAVMVGLITFARLAWRAPAALLG